MLGGLELKYQRPTRARPEPDPQSPYNLSRDMPLTSSPAQNFNLELERVPDQAQSPGPEEKLEVISSIPDTTRAQISAMHILATSTGLEIMFSILGLSKAHI